MDGPTVEREKGQGGQLGREGEPDKGTADFQSGIEKKRQSI